MQINSFSASQNSPKFGVHNHDTTYLELKSGGTEFSDNLESFFRALRQNGQHKTGRNGLLERRQIQKVKTTIANAASEEELKIMTDVISNVQYSHRYMENFAEDLCNAKERLSQ